MEQCGGCYWPRRLAASFITATCVGADKEANGIASAAGLYRVSHPCTITSMRAFTVVDKELPAKPPLVRNKDIVNACELLIAAPAVPEVVRSGTWSTVRYARRAQVPLKIIWPDGSITKELQ